MNAANGGSFLFEDLAPENLFTAEDLSEEQVAIGETVDRFWQNEVSPNLPALYRQEPGAAREIMRRGVGLGLTAISIPERFGGMELDLPSSLVVAEHMARDASYMVWEGGQTTLGTLPLVYFGTERQKQKYLPKLANVELLAAYALTEPQAGSDALAARTRAELNSSGTHYILNGQKAWITNGGDADLFIVFAKVDGDKFTAFLVERAFGGVTHGAEEQKMGLKGSSTTALYLDNVPVPVENVLGEVGRGHTIAFNILNLGRLKLGASVVGAAKDILATSIEYAKQRRAFGSSIAEFGAIQHKLAEMAIRIFATESIVWRTAGLIRNYPGDSILAGAKEFAAECSIVKVFASEMLDYVADEGVQIHGGYGYHQDYAVERTYRDARINRIFEGTNEINRLIIPKIILKRTNRIPAVATNGDAETQLVSNAKQVAALLIALVRQKYTQDLEKQQELMMHIADVLIEVYAMESTLVRSRKIAASGKETRALDISAVFLRDAMGRVELSARNVLGSCVDGAALQQNLATLRRIADQTPVDAVHLRRKIARHLIGSSPDHPTPPAE
jgi:alkylation response protein AidB-like acyl-CoA dehydrogenase